MEVDSAESKQTCLNGPHRSYYIAFIIVSVVALGLGLGLGLGLKKSPPPRALINIPPMQPPVTASVPNALRPSSATWVKTQSAADGHATRSSLMSLQSLTAGAARLAHFSVQAVTDNSSLTAIRDRVFGPGPTDFVTRLGKIDERIQELKTRNLESERGRVCIGEAAQLWTPNFLPAGVAFPMWFSCKEVMDPQGGLTVYFGTQGTTSYVAELQWPATAGTVPRMAVLAAVSNNGTQVEAWQIITGTNSVSYVQIRADRTTNSVEVSHADTAGNMYDIGCGIRLRTSSTRTWAAGDFKDLSRGASSPCNGTTTHSVCADSVTLVSVAHASCSSIQTFSTAALTNATLVNENLVSRAAAGIQTPAGMPTLTSFTVVAP